MSAEENAGGIDRRAVAAYASAGLLLTLYAGTLIFRPVGRVWPIVDNGLVDAFEVAMWMALSDAVVVDPQCRSHLPPLRPASGPRCTDRRRSSWSRIPLAV